LRRGIELSFDEVISLSKPKCKERKVTNQYKYEIEPNDVTVQIKTLFSEAQQASSKTEYKIALQKYDQLLQIDPQHEQALLEKGINQEMIGLFYDAIETFSIVLALSPDNLEARIHRARDLVKIEDFFASKVDYDNALLIVNDPILYIEQAEVLIRMNDYENALKYLLKIPETAFMDLDQLIKRRFLFTKASCLNEIGKTMRLLQDSLS